MAYPSRSRQSRDRRKVTRVVIGAVVVLVLLFVVLPGELNTGKQPSQDRNTTTTTMSLSDIRSIYEGIASEYTATLASSNAVIAAAGADITTQGARIQNDGRTYTANESGSGCSGGAGNFDSCLANEQLTAQAALVDENAAERTAKADVTKQVRSLQQIEAAISSFVQQLDAITWPSSVSSVESSLTHLLDNQRSTYVQVAADVAGGKTFSTDNQPIAAATSAVVTQLTSMTSALGVAVPSSTAAG